MTRLSDTKFYRKFSVIKYRCNNKNAENYKWYGAKGIKVEWENFEEFKNDMHDSYLNHVKAFGEKNTTIDRIDNSKNYCKENCKWSTWKIQHKNTTSVINIEHKGEILNINEWSKKLNIHPQTLYSRLSKLKMPIELVLTSKKFVSGKKWQKQL